MTIAETGLPGRPKTRPAAEPDAGLAWRLRIGRLAGPQRDAPEDLLDAERRERGADVVVLADRDAAADDRDVAPRAPARAPPRSARAVVGGRSRPPASSAPARSTSAATECAFELRIAPGPQRLARLLQLVAGGQHADPRPPRAGDLVAIRPRRARRARPAPSSAPGSSTVSPAAMSSPARRMSRPGSTAAAIVDLARAAVGVLDPDHGVGARRDHRPGRDRDRLARAERAPRPGARRATRRRREARRPLGARARGVGGADRVAVHRRVVEPRDVVGAGRPCSASTRPSASRARPAPLRARRRARAPAAAPLDLDQLPARIDLRRLTALFGARLR